MEEKDMKIVTSDDSNVDPPVDMDLLVDEQPDTEQEYRDGENKEPETQEPNPDKVVEADLAMDPAAATESFLHRMMCMTDEDLERGTEDFEKINELSDIGVNFQTRSIENIKVVDKHFDKIGYNSFEDFSISDAGEYARESLSNKFSQILRPVSMKDYNMNKNTFNNLIFNKTVKEFKDKYLNPNIASRCSYTVNGPDVYGTTSVNVRFKSKEGKNSPIGAIYALEWYKGQPAVSPIVPIMKIDQSIEKFFGYFKKSDFEDDGYPKNINDFFNRPVTKEKIKKLKEDIKKKGESFPTSKEVEEGKITFGSKYIRGVNPQKNNSIVEYMEKDGIVWAYWYMVSGFRKSFSVVALVKNKSGKIKTVGFAIGLNFSSKVDIKKSKESYYFDPLTDLM